MVGQFTVDGIQRLRSSQHDSRQRPLGERDDNGDRYATTPSKAVGEKTELKPPTNAEQAELLRLALEKGLRADGFKGVALRQELREWEHVFSSTRARYLHALNPYARGKWAGILHEVIKATDFDDSPWKVTIIGDDWMFGTYPRGPSERDLRWMLSRMRSAVRRSLRGVPYLLQADFAVRRHDAGHRIAIEVHWHGLVWASEATVEALKKRLPANRFGADRFRARSVYNLLGALRYVTKDTRVGYRTVKNFGFQPGSRHWKEWFQHRETLYGPKRLLLIAMTGNLTKPELCAASGVGLAVLREAKRLAKAQGYRAAPVVVRRTAYRRKPSRRRRAR